MNIKLNNDYFDILKKIEGFMGLFKRKNLAVQHSIFINYMFLLVLDSKQSEEIIDSTMMYVLNSEHSKEATGSTMMCVF